MSHPNIIYGEYGDEKEVSTAKIGSLPLGTLMILPDGRKFRHARMGATAAAAGKLYMQGGAVADTMFTNDLVCASADVGDKTLTITTGGTTAVAASYYDDGYVHTASSVGTGIGYTYKVKSAASAAAGSASCVITLEDNDAVKVATEGGTTKVGLRANEYNLCTLKTANTVGVGTLAGIACATTAASTYCWLQRGGICSAFADATTIVIGTPLGASTTVAGAVALLAGTAAAAVAQSYGQIGWCVTPAASAEFHLIDLQLE